MSLSSMRWDQHQQVVFGLVALERALATTAEGSTDSTLKNVLELDTRARCMIGWISLEALARS